MKRVYSTMLRLFQPKDEIDAQIYELVVGANKNISQKVDQQIRLNSGILSDANFKQRLLRPNDDEQIAKTDYN